MSSSAPTPTPKRVAIIGTACRGPDRGKIDGKLFATLQEFAAFMIRDVWQLSSVVLVSGGAPGADHLAVRLFASGAYEGLRLHLPARWSGSAFNNRDRDGFKINLLHAQFAHDTGIGSLRELGRAIKGGAECVASPDGFLARNVSLAQDCDYMLAFGWDEGLEPTRRGGTAYTWRRAPARVVKKYMDINGWLPRGPVPEEPPRTVRGQRSLGECKAWEVPKTIKKRPARAAPPPAPRPRGFSVVAGDLFRAPVEASLGHCVSRDLVMGAGIAVEFKRRFGRVAQLRDQHAPVGGLAFLYDEGRFIFYLVTKERYNHLPTPEALRGSLEAMREFAIEHGVRHICLPRIGCGCDRMRWSQVAEILGDVFEGAPVEVTVYDNRVKPRRV